MPELGICEYIAYREQEFLIGLFLIPISSLHITPQLQRPFDKTHSDNLKQFYNLGSDGRSGDPLDCVVSNADKERFALWLEQQDKSKLVKLKPADLLVIDLSDISFSIIQGQHRLRAYSSVMAEGDLPADAPHPECLCVKLYYLDPADPDNDRLYALGAYSNVPKAQKMASEHSLTRLVLHFAWSLIRDNLSDFGNEASQAHLRKALKGSILSAYQVDLMKVAAVRTEKRLPLGWVGSKIFLDHHLVQIFIKVLKCRLGTQFTVTRNAMEELFHKTENLPFLTVLFTDIYALIEGFNFEDGTIPEDPKFQVTLKLALTSKNPISPHPSDMKRWRKLVEDFEDCWVPLRKLNFTQLLNLKDRFKKAALVFRVLGVLLHGTTLWDKEQSLNGDFAQKNKQKLTTECHTFVPWSSTSEGVLRHFIYNKSVATETFGDTKHYCLIKDEDGKVNTKVYEVVTFIWKNHSQFTLPPEPFDKHISFHSASTHLVNRSEFLKSVSDNASSCSMWRKLLKDILGLGANAATQLPSGLVINLEELPSTSRPSTPPELRRLSTPSLPPPPPTDRLGSPSGPSKGRQYVGLSPPQVTSSKGKATARDGSYNRFFQESVEAAKEAARYAKAQEMRRAQEKLRAETERRRRADSSSSSSSSSSSGSSSSSSSEKDSERDKAVKAAKFAKAQEKLRAESERRRRADSSSTSSSSGNESEKDEVKGSGDEDMDEEKEDQQRGHEEEEEEAQSQQDEDEEDQLRGEEEKQDQDHQRGEEDGEGAQSPMDVEKEVQQRGHEEEGGGKAQPQQDEEGDQLRGEEEEKQDKGHQRGEEEGEGAQSPMDVEKEVQQRVHEEGEEEGAQPQQDEEGDQLRGEEDKQDHNQGDEEEGEGAQPQKEVDEGGGEGSEKGNQSDAPGQPPSSEEEEGRQAEGASKKRQAVAEEAVGPRKQARYTSAEEQGEEDPKFTETQVTLPNADELIAANSRHSIPYMDSAMDPQEIREYIHSFVDDGRIPSQTLFNLFQTTLRMFNAGGGLIKLNRWDVAPYEQGNLPRVFLDDEDVSLPLIEAEASTSRTYPTQEQDVEMKERDGSGGSSGSDKEA